jgi:outer membrane protein OmpA-like peptidoglycan-associated protein
MNRPIAACWRPLLFGLLGLGLVSLLPTCAGPNARAGAQHLIADAEQTGAAAMAAAGFGWAGLKIGADGVARLTGQAPSPEAAAAALDAAQTALAARTGLPGVIARFASDSAPAPDGAAPKAPDGAAPKAPDGAAPKAPLVAEAPAVAPMPAAKTPAPPAPVAAAPGQTPPPKTAPAAPIAVGDGGPRDCQRALNAAMRTNPIRFASGSAAVAGVGRRNFDRLAAVVAACDSHKLRVAGHTDRRGAAAFNQRLSEDRARAVLALLVEAGADRSALSAWGYGETRPLNRRSTPAAHAVNRRIEITVLAP